MIHRILIAIASLVLIFFGTRCMREVDALEVKSFNVRYDNPADSVNRWENRLPLIESYLNTEVPDIIGMQEVLHHQLEDLQSILPDYQYAGVGRDDGKKGGEFCPVFYRNDAFELMAKSHFWLSQTPDIPGSKSWGAHLPRVVTWLKLKNLETGHIFFFFNTHLSHVSKEARQKSIALLLWKMDEIAGKAPVILTGDFNTTRDTETFSRIITSYEGFYALWDAEKLTAGKVTGGDRSYNAFNDSISGTRIDFIFVNGYIDVLRHSVDEVKQGDVFISDHFPVSAKIRFRPNFRDREGTEQTPIDPGIQSRRETDRDDLPLLDNRTMFF